MLWICRTALQEGVGDHKLDFAWKRMVTPSTADNNIKKLVLEILSKSSIPVSSADIASILLTKYKLDVEKSKINRSLHELRSEKKVTVDTGTENRWRAASKLLVQPSTAASQAPTKSPMLPVERQTIVQNQAPKITPVSIEASNRLPEIKKPFGASKFSKARVEILHALESEIAELKEGKGGKSVSVQRGKLIREQADSFIYKFHLESFLVTIEDSPAELRLGKKSVPCQVISVDEMEVELSVQEFLGDFVAHATLGSSTWFLLEQLRKKFEDLSDRDAPRFSMSERLFSGKSARVSDSANLDIEKGLYEAQIDALRKAQTHNLSIIWGPPGTGKTKTIATIIKTFVKSGRKVLLVSHANTAVDEALEKVADALKNDDLYSQGKLVRLGRCKKESLEQKFPMVILDRIIAHKADDLSRKRDELQAEIRGFEKQISKLTVITLSSSRLDALKKRIEELVHKISSLRARRQTLSDTIKNSRIETKEKELLLSKSRNHKGLGGGLSRLLKGLPSPEVLERELTNIAVKCEQTVREIEQIESQITKETESHRKVTKEASNTEAELDKLLSELSQPVGVIQPLEVIGKAISSLNRRLTEGREEVNQLTAFIDKLEIDVISQAALVATTLTKVYTDKRLPDEPFDVVVIDEASAAPLPQIYWAAQRARGHLIIVGDFRQLPPIGPTSKDELAQKWFSSSIFDVMGIFNVQQARKDKRITLLDTQHRMSPVISTLSNQLYYENLLKDGETTRDKYIYSAVGENCPLVLVNTFKASPWANQLREGSRFNIHNALVCIALAQKLVDENREDLGKIGIVTPYRAQATLIRKMADDRGLADKVYVNTVHSFQGGEQPVVIFDTVDSPGIQARKGSMLDKSQSDQLINVALTRAQKKLIIVCNREYINSQFKETSDIVKIIKAAGESEKYYDSSEFLSAYDDQDFDRWIRHSLDQAVDVSEVPTSIHTEKSFWSVFLGDLRMAKENVLIVSAFIAKRRAQKIMNELTLLRRAGVDICIQTRSNQPPNLVDDAHEFIEHCKELGIRVVQKYNMHEKIAVIDRKILWEGSLNILSHNESSEQMRRFEGPDAAKEILSKLELEQSDGQIDQVVDKCCSICGAPLIIKENRKFRTRFYGCSKYPECNYTEKFADGTAFPAGRRRNKAKG